MSFLNFASDKRVITMGKQLPMITDAVAAYAQLCKANSSMTGLLETASISSKEHTRSLIVLSAALNLRCIGEQVVVTALNNNGEQLLPSFMHALTERNFVVTKTDGGFSLEISHLPLKSKVVEQEKLKVANVFDVLRVLLKLIKVGGHDDKATYLIGSFSFDCYELFEDLPETGDEKNFADYDFYLADRLLIIDHQQNASRLVSKVFNFEQVESIYFDYQQQLAKDEAIIHSETSLEPLQATFPHHQTCVQTEPNNEAFARWVEQARQHIVDGDIFQVVLARNFRLPCTDPFLAYRYLRRANPSPYMFYLSTPDYALLGASPESAVKFNAESRKLSIYPIAGTRKRGKDANGNIDYDLDARIELELKSDEKERAEHSMLVDLARNDVARVCESGSRRIERLFEIDRYSHVMHLVSKVSGRLKPDLDALAAYQACLNMGTLTGAPKVKATQLIRHFERKRRGIYGGATGYLNAAGDLDTAIVIRSALIKNNIATVTAGAGIVYDSVAQLEIKETENKAAAVIQAIEAANEQVQQLNDKSNPLLGGTLMTGGTF
jgi:anthranilate synthase component 1